MSFTEVVDVVGVDFDECAPCDVALVVEVAREVEFDGAAGDERAVAGDVAGARAYVNLWDECGGLGAVG